MAEGNAKNLSVLFVCIGNSCRSPMAESILKKAIAKHPNENWHIDSAALRSWNVGLSPEPRCIEILGQHGLKSNHLARQISVDDFHHFDYIFGMDDMNMQELNELAPDNCKAKVQLLGDHGDPKNKIILDPYFERGMHGFVRCFDQISLCCKNFVETQLNRIDGGQI